MKYDNAKDEINFYKSTLMNSVCIDLGIKDAVKQKYTLDGFPDDFLIELVKRSPRALSNIGKNRQTVSIVIAAFNRSIEMYKDNDNWDDHCWNNYKGNLPDVLYRYINKRILKSKEFKQSLIDSGYLELLNKDINWEAFYVNLLDDFYASLDVE